MSSSLVAHNPRFQAHFVTKAHLAQLPIPAPLGRWHSPVSHADLIEVITCEAGKRNLIITGEKYALGSKGHSIFGVLDFKGAHSDRAVSLGFRNSTDQSLALQGVAGSHVFVCDNLALSGEFKAWNRKNTVNVNLYYTVRDGFDMFQEQGRQFERAIERLNSHTVTDEHAKARMFDVFDQGILPARLLPEASKNYLAPTADMTDCTPRTLWGVHNALTRVARNLAPSSLMDATTRLGRVFDIA